MIDRLPDLLQQRAADPLVAVQRAPFHARR